MLGGGRREGSAGQGRAEQGRAEGEGWWIGEKSISSEKPVEGAETV